MSSSLSDFAHSKLQELEARHLRRELVVTDRRAANTAIRVVDESRSQVFVSFCCNDYLNLNHRSEVMVASIAAIQRYGAGAGASRLVTGNHPLLAELEERLATFKGTESAVVFGSGYLANTGIVPTLVGTGDLVLVDELAHACLNTGAQLSQAEVLRFRHNDLDHLAELLSAHRDSVRHAMILTDGVFSMDGDLAPLPGMVQLARAYDAWLMTDDAHGIGVIGGGHGSTFAFGDQVSPHDVPLQMGTLSKAIGSTGGYLCGAKEVIDLIKTRARTLVYATGLSPAATGAAIEALKIIESDPALCGRPLEHAQLFAREVGLAEPKSPIVPLIMGSAEAALSASAMLEAQGFLVSAIRPPTVPEGTARLRFTFTAEHDVQDIQRLAEIVRADVLPRVAA